MQRIDADTLKRFPQPFRLRWRQRTLHFKHPAATSRGVLFERRTFILEAATADGCGYGECCTMPGLLPEPTPEELDYWCARVEKKQGLPEEKAPSPIQFGMECALLAALRPGQPRWDTPFARGEAGIPIHHLIWMSSIDNMLESMQQGIDAGFTCLKMKVGALPLATELEILREAHAAFPQAELRVDANGAFTPLLAPAIFEAMAAAGVSSIEQPLRPGLWREMAELCSKAPLTIALDEELIGTSTEILEIIRPQAIVIKPALHGGLLAAQSWAQCADDLGIRWWVNSALESHIGLAALAEWCAWAAPGTMQGLGKGNLFTDDDTGRIRLIGNSLYMTTTAQD